MIITVSELVKRLIEHEEIKITEYGLSCEPIFRKMCVVLPDELIHQAIPFSLNLNIKSGFIHDPLGYKARYISCMLVKGDGLRIGYSSECTWNIEDVVAIFEINKTICERDLKESIESLKDIYQCYYNYVRIGKLNTGAEDSALMEQLCPIRVMLGYFGPESKRNFQDTIKLLTSEHLSEDGVGIGYFPNVVLSGSYSFVRSIKPLFSSKVNDCCRGLYELIDTNPLHLVIKHILVKSGLG